VYSFTSDEPGGGKKLKKLEKKNAPCAGTPL
jgi:hypothetical protein